jgi:hypothetical protein
MMSAEDRKRIGNRKGGLAEVPKGLARVSAKKRKAIIAKAIATRKRKAMDRAKNRNEMDAIWTRKGA